MMKKIAIIFLLSKLVFPLFAQNYSNIDHIVDAYPRISDPEKLAALINEDFNTDLEKARAIYRWVANNITYDINAYYAGSKAITYTYSSPEEKKRKELEIRKKQIHQTLKKRTAVCEGYSGLFQNLCELTGLECVTILGYSKTFDRDIGKVQKNTDHAWNAVKIENKWQLIDVTWGAGSVDYAKKEFIKKFTDIYFCTPPELFFLKHFPEDRQWLFIDKTLQDFIELPLYYTEFALTGMKVIKPKSGILKIKPNEKLSFKWESELETGELNYGFKGDKYARELKIEKDGDMLDFQVEIGKSVPEFLTFYYKGSAVITYKLEKK